MMIHRCHAALDAGYGALGAESGMRSAFAFVQSRRTVRAFTLSACAVSSR